MTDELRTYTGECHCGKVRFELKTAPITSALECNCSHCSKKGLLLVFLPKAQFTLKSGEGELIEYRFNTKTIAHQFCRICGVQPFAFGKDREGNATASINVRCVDDIDLDTLTRNPFKGRDM